MHVCSSEKVSHIVRSAHGSEIFMRAVACTQVNLLHRVNRLDKCRLQRIQNIMQMQMRGMDPTIGPSVEVIVSVKLLQYLLNLG